MPLTRAAMKKPLIFISHITEEKEIALALKELISANFLDMIEVFVSTDPSSIKAGRRWLDEITDALKTCVVEIILASPKSVTRPWINFEAGSGWIRGIQVIPVCHSQMIPTKLPAPLNSLQSVIIDNAGLNMIVSALAEAAKCRLPTVDFSSLIAKVREFEETSKQITALEKGSSVQPTAGLMPHELETLITIADLVDTPDEKIIGRRIKDRLKEDGLRSIGVNLSLSSLARKSFVSLESESDYNHNQYTVVQITNEGWSWLEQNQDRIKLRHEDWSSDTIEPAPPQDEVPF